jgi:dTDP-L-rhamnose 4-epimerase
VIAVKHDLNRNEGLNMRKRILITGGAGFIGSHLADELLAHGYGVRVLDSLSPQVHGAGRRKPDYLSSGVEFLQGDTRNPAQVRKALEHTDAVFHFAAAVGVGQSMYELEHYVDTNNYGTAVLLEALLEFPVEKLIVASSMSIYGEGLYQNSEGRAVAHRGRTLDQL